MGEGRRKKRVNSWVGRLEDSRMGPWSARGLMIRQRDDCINK